MTSLPLRQKIFLLLTILSGIFLVIAYHTAIFKLETFRLMLFVFGIAPPIIILSGNALIDLNTKKIFKIWAILSIGFIITYVLTKNIPDLAIRRSQNFDNSGINKLIASSSSSPLKALPLFLLSYWFLNNYLKRKTGKFMVSTFKLHKWFNKTAKREVDWLDVMLNLILYAVILLSSLFDF